MTRNFSPISNIVLIIIHLVTIWALAALSYGWSLDQTEAFASAITGAKWSQAAALLIQLSPQMLLVAASLYTLQKKRSMARGLIIAALVINALDAFTNIVAFNEWWPSRAALLIEQGRSLQFVNATRPVGQIFAFLVTWFEEALSIALGSMLQLIADYLEAVGRRPPRFFRSGIVAAGGFDFRGVDKAAKQQQHAANGQQQRNQGAPRVSTQAQPVNQQRQQPRQAQGRRQWPG
jgi:hypothetical protein